MAARGGVVRRVVAFQLRWGLALACFVGCGPAIARGHQIARGPGAVAALRTVLAAGVALVIVAMLAGLAQAAGPKSNRYQAGEQHEVQAARNAFREQARGTLQLVVSIGRQHVTLYSNGTRIAQVPVSSGRSDHPTPTGVFSVIEKDRWHRSNLYDNAPMFYMQRITWSGVAMHEGMLPGVPASHGCIRLPREFAARLWGVTKLGVRVVVAQQEVVPQDFSHLALFNPKPKIEPKPEPKPDPKPDPRPEQKPRDDIVAATGRIIGLRSTIVLDGMMTARDARATSFAVVDFPLGPAAADPVKPEPAKPAAEAPKRGGQVAVFVSRKEKRIFVRQGFAPLFDLPIEIAQPELPLGTHVFTALEVQDNGAMRWNVMSMPGGAARPAERAGDNGRRGGRNREPVPVVDAGPPPTAVQALERLQMPPEAIERIGEILVPGSSLVISDQGLGRETGRGTEFIVLTR
jgi:hypothetical protein